MPNLTQDEMIAQANAHGFPNLRVACPIHGIDRAKDGSWTECAIPECQPWIAARKAEVRKASAPTEEDKARWREGLIGRAKAK